MKNILTWMVAWLVSLAGFAQGAVVGPLTSSQYGTIGGSPQTSMIAEMRAGGTGPGNYEYSIRATGGTLPVTTADFIWQSGVAVNVNVNYAGGLITMTVNGTNPLTYRPTQSFDALAFKLSTGGSLGVSVAITNVVLTQTGFSAQNLPGLSVTETDRFDGYTVVPDNLAAWNFAYKETQNWTIAQPSDNDWNSPIAAITAAQLAQTPEPGSAILLLIGCTIIVIRRKRNQTPSFPGTARPPHSPAPPDARPVSGAAR